MPRILIVSAYFSPSVLIGARRPERFASELERRGWEVSVLTLHPSQMRPTDPQAVPLFSGEVIRTGALMPGDAVRGILDRLARLRPRLSRPGSEGRGGSPGGGASRGGIPRRLARMALRALARLEFPDRWRGWQGPALRAVEGRRFDVVLATTPPFTTVCIGRAIARRTGALHVMDYRDPWYEAPRLHADGATSRSDLERHRRAEDECLAEASLVLAASRTLAGWLSRRSGKQVEFLPNTCRQEPVSPVESTAPGTVLSYLGSMAYGRSLAPVMNALAALDSRGAARDLRLVYAGGDQEQVVQEARAAGVETRLECLGNVTRDRARELMRSSALGLVVTSRGYEYGLPGKMVEYLGLRTPMLLLAPSDAEAAQVFREHGMGTHCRPDDLPGITSCLERALEKTLPCPAVPAEFETDAALDRLDRKLRALISG